MFLGACGSGRRSFAARHFPSASLLSGEACPPFFSSPAVPGTPSPGLPVTGLSLTPSPLLPFTSPDLLQDSDYFQSDPGFFPAAMVELHRLVRKRLFAGRQICVIAPTLQAWQRRPLLSLARRTYVQAIAIVFDLPRDLLIKRNLATSTPDLSREEVTRQVSDQVTALHQSLPGLEKEGFFQVHTLTTPEQVEAAQVLLQPMPSDFKTLRGPFDIISDVHGCAGELEELLARLDYEPLPAPASPALRFPASSLSLYRSRQGRLAIFIGDLVDRGPRILDTVDLVRTMVSAGTALCIPGNHDDKFMRMLMGRRVRIENGLETSLAELETLPDGTRGPYEDALRDFFQRLPSHLVLDRGQLVIAHAGIKSSMIGREAPRVRAFTLYGETSGETDPYGLPVRLNWAAHYHGKARIIYGHTPVAEPTWQNRTIDIDTGCVYGGRLTALRYPEMELVSVPARRTYAESKRPFHGL